MVRLIPSRRDPLSAVALLAILALAGCGLAPGPSSAPATAMDGSYTGSLSSDEGTAFGTLTVTQAGNSIRLTLVMPDISLNATGTGTVSGTSFRGDLSYTLGCPGTIVLTGVQQVDGRELTGSFTSADCNVENTGSFRFILRDT
jgi:hypothetical protein